MKIKVVFSCIFVLCVFTGCPDEMPCQEFISTDKYEIEFSANGDCDTITKLDGSNDWWIGNVVAQHIEKEVDKSRNIVLKKIIDEVVYSLSPRRNCEDIQLVDSMRLETEWFCVYIPKENKKQVVIECYENKDDTERQLELFLYDDKSYKRLSNLIIHQKGLDN